MWLSVPPPPCPETLGFKNFGDMTHETQVSHLGLRLRAPRKVRALLVVLGAQRNPDGAALRPGLQPSALTSRRKCCQCGESVTFSPVSSNTQSSALHTDFFHS